MQDQAAQYESKVRTGQHYCDQDLHIQVFIVFYVEYDFQLAGKDQEILYLKQENESTKRRYEEIYGTKLEDLAEVRVYSGLIVPEIQRMRRSVPTNLNGSLNLGQSKSSLTIVIPQSEREQEPGPEPGEDVQHQLQQ